jgi:hypothetical protein
MKPTYTLPSGKIKKYTGKRDVKAFWYFEFSRGNDFHGGFSLDLKAAHATSKSTFRLYKDGGHKLVTGSIVVVEL